MTLECNSLKTFLLLKGKGVLHGISTRVGGVSSGAYESLNLGLHVGDEAPRVIQNRSRLIQCLGKKLEQVTVPQQVHSSGVKVVTREDRGKGASDHGTAVPNCDALITSVRGVVLMILVADCVPILIYDPTRKVVAAVHAGWRGTSQEIAARTVWAMVQSFGTNPEDLFVGVGPAIGLCHYEVDQSTIEALSVSVGWNKDCWRTSVNVEKYMVDLQQANRNQLICAGVSESRIETMRECTYCEKQTFFSARRESGACGRFSASISLDGYNE